MIDWLVIIFIIMAILFMFGSIEKMREHDWFWSFIFTLLGTVVWFILAASILEVEVPYEIYNATSGNIETGVHTVTSKVAPEMVYFFQMMALVMLVINVAVLFLGISDFLKKKGIIKT